MSEVGPDESGPRPIPLTLALIGWGLIGGLGGGITVALLLTVGEMISRGPSAGEGWFVATIIGSFAGLVLGTSMGVLASLLRLIVVGAGAGLAAELVAVVVGALVTPWVFVALLGFEGWQGAVIVTVIGALAGWHFCRVIFKRVRREAPVIPGY